MEQQVQGCADQCINIFGDVTNTPKKLVPCLQDLIPQFDSFSDCMQASLDSWVPPPPPGLILLFQLFPGPE